MKDYFINEISTIIDEEKISHVQLSQKIEAKIDDDKFFRAKGVKLASDSTVLPSPPSDSTVLPVLASVSTGIREFQIPLEDIFGNDLPEVLDPKDSIIFSLRELEAHVIGSLQGTTWSRALQRAKKHMKEKGVWKERETFTQSKRRECPFCTKLNV